MSSTVDTAAAASTLGGYRITDVLGAGGMGMVYVAHHELLGRKAALKVLLPELSHDQEVVGRFFGEARAATAIRHPGIVKVYDFGFESDGRAFLAMEFLDGEPLDARLARLGPMPVVQALRLTAQMVSALAAAHGHGIVHRDLKPGNVFVVPDPQVPGGERIKLLDFGIAKFSAGDDPRSNHTRAGAIMGSPAYMAPEQCRGLPDVDPRADLYSVGCMLLEMLTGRPPFDGGGQGALAIMSQHLHDPPPVPSALRADVPPAVDAVVACLLAKDPAQRYPNAAALGYALSQVSGEQVEFSSLPGVTAEHAPGTSPMLPGPSQLATLRDPTRPELPPRPKSGRGALLAALGIFAAVAGGSTAVVLSGPDAPAPPPVTVAPPPDVAPSPPPPPPKPRKPAFTFRQLEDAAPVARPVTAPPPVVLDGARLPSFSFSLRGLWTGSLFTGMSFGDLLGAFRAFAAMAPPPRVITWRVASTPPGASVLDGDTVVGTTASPLVVTFDEAPDYQTTLILRLDGYDDAPVELSGGQDADRTVALVPRIPVSIASKPAGAAILDASGASLGVTPATVLLSKSDAAVPLTLRLDGFEDRPLAVVPDRARSERAVLTKVRREITVHLESTPPGASVEKGGQVLGVTPLDDRFLEEKGRVAYTLRLEGHKDQVVKLAGDRDASKTIELRPARKAVTRKCPPKSDAGTGTKPALFNPYERC